MKILFVGDLNEYGRSYQRFRTLKAMGHAVVGISHTRVPWLPGIDSISFVEKLLWKLSLPPDTTSVNAQLYKAAMSGNCHLVWIEKGVTIFPATLKAVKKFLPNAPLISLSEDDMTMRHSRSRYYDRGLHYYDIVFTTKRYNVQELLQMGARKTEFFLDSFDEMTHRPLELSQEDMRRFGCDVSAIGTFETDRAESLLYLAEQGVAISIWGNGWKSWIGKHPNLKVHGGHLFGDDYPKAIQATKINLHFLRKVNRDEITSRSMEIPACGGFMLAEKTNRHLEFFKDGEEAVFFDSKEHLLSLVREYLNNDELRHTIASAGRMRCLASRYGMREQLEGILGLSVSL